jgi:hypothetical protein
MNELDFKIYRPESAAPNHTKILRLGGSRDSLILTLTKVLYNTQCDQWGKMQYPPPVDVGQIPPQIPTYWGQLAP